MLSTNKRNHIVWLIPYLEGELDPKRAAILERELARNSALAEEADRLRSHLGLIRSAASTAPRRDPEFSILPKVQAELRARPGQNYWSNYLTLAASSAAAICIAVAVAHSLQTPDENVKPVQVASARSPQLDTFGVPPGVMQIGAGVGNVVKDKLSNMDGLVAADAPKMMGRLKVAKPKNVEIKTVKSHGHRLRHNRVNSWPANSDPFDARTPTYAFNSSDNDSENIAGNLSNMTASRERSRNLGDSVAGPARYDAQALRDRALKNNVNAEIGDNDYPVTHGGAVSAGNNTFSSPEPSGVQAVGTAGKISVIVHDYAGQPGAGSQPPVVMNGYSQHKLTRADPVGGVFQTLPTDDQNISDWSAHALALANRGQTRQAMDVWRDALMLQLQSPNYDDETDSGVATDILNSIKSTGNLAAFRAIVKQQATRQYLPTVEELPDWRILGQIDTMQGRYTEALNAWQHVVDTGAANGEDWYQLAVVRQKLGNAAGARAAYQNAMKSLPFLSEHQALAQQYLTKSH